MASRGPQTNEPASIFRSARLVARDDPARQLVPLEELNLALVFYRCFARLECAEITALTGFRILLSRIEPIRARFQLANHERPPCKVKQQGLCLNGLGASRL